MCIKDLNSALQQGLSVTHMGGQVAPGVGTSSGVNSSIKRYPDYQKICAKLGSGVRFGFSFVPERSCGTECTTCTGSAFQRSCRLFNFRPHFGVRLEQKGRGPGANVSESSPDISELTRNVNSIS
jgi:hypothetical protein